MAAIESWTQTCPTLGLARKLNDGHNMTTTNAPLNSGKNSSMPFGSRILYRERQLWQLSSKHPDIKHSLNLQVIWLSRSQLSLYKHIVLSGKAFMDQIWRYATNHPLALIWWFLRRRMQWVWQRKCGSLRSPMCWRMPHTYDNETCQVKCINSADAYTFDDLGGNSSLEQFCQSEENNMVLILSALGTTPPGANWQHATVLSFLWLPYFSCWHSMHGGYYSA